MIRLLFVFAIAGALTTLWFGGAVIYVGHYVGWDNLFTLMPNDLALFAFGVFGPIALIWLVIGLLQITLSSHRQEVLLQQMLIQHHRTSGQAEAQIRTLIQMQEENRRRLSQASVELVLQDLNAQAATLAERLGMLAPEEVTVLWNRVAAGDLWAFSYAFLLRAELYPDFAEMLGERLPQDATAFAALQVFLRRYDMLVTSLKNAGADKVAHAVLDDGPLARLSQLFAVANQRGQSHARPLRRDAAPPEPPVGNADQIEDTMSRLQDVVRQLDTNATPSPQASFFASP